MKQPHVVKQLSRRIKKEQIKKKLLDLFAYDKNINKENLKQKC